MEDAVEKRSQPLRGGVFGARIRLLLEVRDPNSRSLRRRLMRRCSGSTLLVVLFLALAVLIPHLSAQVDRITIAAGTDEDHALQAISAEQDPQKKITMYAEFVQKFSANPAAAAYGDWQLAQAYQAAGDLQKSLEYGDKALAASPRNLDILVSQAGVAQQAKNNVKLMDY